MVDQSESRKQHKHSVEMCCARWFLHQPLMSKLFSASVTQRLVHRKKWILTPRKTGFEKISKKKSNKLNPTERKKFNSVVFHPIQSKVWKLCVSSERRFLHCWVNWIQLPWRDAINFSKCTDAWFETNLSWWGGGLLKWRYRDVC